MKTFFFGFSVILMLFSSCENSGTKKAKDFEILSCENIRIANYALDCSSQVYYSQLFNEKLMHEKQVGSIYDSLMQFKKEKNAVLIFLRGVEIKLIAGVEGIKESEADTLRLSLFKHASESTGISLLMTDNMAAIDEKLKVIDTYGKSFRFARNIASPALKNGKDSLGNSFLNLTETESVLLIESIQLRLTAYENQLLRLAIVESQDRIQ